MTYYYRNSYFIEFNDFQKVSNIKNFSDYINSTVKNFHSDFYVYWNLSLNRIDDGYQILVKEGNAIILRLDQYQSKQSYRIQALSGAHRTIVYLMVRLINKIIQDWGARVKDHSGSIETLPILNSYMEFVKTLYQLKVSALRLYKEDRKTCEKCYFFDDQKFNNFD